MLKSITFWIIVSRASMPTSETCGHIKRSFGTQKSKYDMLYLPKALLNVENNKDHEWTMRPPRWISCWR